MKRRHPSSFSLWVLVATACEPVTPSYPDGGDAQDVVAIVASDSSLSVLEGSNAHFTVALSGDPGGALAINIESSDSSKGTVTPASLQFDSSNWSVPQEVVVAAAQDPDASDDHLQLVVSSDVGNASIEVTVRDDDMLVFETSVPTLGVAEGSQTMFGVRLSAQPAAAVVVNIASNIPTSMGVSPTTMTFSTANWSTYQNVIVSGAEDNNLVGESASATMAAVGLVSKSVSVTTTDNDTQALVVSQTATMIVDEGTSGTFRVRLAFMPTATTIALVSSSVTAAATVSPTSLTFTTTNWNADQTVTVSGINDDANYTHDSSAITISSTGVPPRSFTVDVPDNDLINPPSMIYACKFDPQPAYVRVPLRTAPYEPVLTVMASASVGSIVPVGTGNEYTAANYGSGSQHSYEYQAPLTGTTATLTFSAVGQTSKTVTVTLLPATEPECQ